MAVKLERIRFNKVDGVIKGFDGNRYLVLFGHAIYNWIRYLIKHNSSIPYVLSHIMQESKWIHMILYLEKKC